MSDAVRINNPSATGEVRAHGAHVTAWTPAGGDPVLWLSPLADLSLGSAIRGGVPVCFPWFGNGPGDAYEPKHGFARNATWTVVERTDECVRLRLTDADVADLPGRDRWPHAFTLELAVCFGTDLLIELTCTNSGDTPFSYGNALHSYFAVDDVRQTTVAGLGGASYRDKVSGGSDVQDGPIRFTGETDRVYESVADAVVDDGTRRIMIIKTGSADTVVWNPWQDKAAKMSDVPDDAWPHLVCIEAANAPGHEITLAPGASHALSQRIKVPERSAQPS
ncbi:MAG: D-hexose-6-phosphate mutarotase [Propionibacteriales bacterium]|nr:D-hexose-6-phosphate mutarotase [Propionibacteriales bacterium]